MAILSKTSVIRTRVMQHIHARIDAAQKECDVQHAELDTAFSKEKDELERKLFQDKQDVIDRLVTGIIGKIM